MDAIGAMLFEGESVLYRTRKHWVVFIKSAVLWCLALAAFYGREPVLAHAHFTVPAEFQKFLDIAVEWTVKGVLIGLAVLFAYMALGRMFSFFTTVLAVTKKRLIVYDRLAGSLVSFDVSRIESVEASPGFFGPILGYGAISVTTGSGRRTVVADLAKPHRFEKELFAVK